MPNVYKDNHYESMMYLSPEGIAMERELKALADKYGYRALPKEKSAEMRERYLAALPDFWKNGEDVTVDTANEYGKKAVAEYERKGRTSIERD